MSIIVFIYGLIIGSFLNVCIYRIPNNQSLIYPSSHCTSCNKKIKWYDLIPVISYIILKGRCRFCKEKISAIYPLVELFTGIVFVYLYYKFGLTFYFFKYAVFICLLIVIAMIDLNTMDVYFNTIAFGTIIGIIFTLINYQSFKAIISYLLGAIFAGGILSLIIVITKGMGWGDAEICFMCGLYLGFKLSAIMLLLSFILGAIVGVILILLKKKTRKDYIPFGPYIALASLIALFWGEKIISFYLKSLMF